MIFSLQDKNSGNFHPQLKNRVVHSRLTHYIKPESESGISLKYVRNGTEHYRVGQNSFDLVPGKYLVVNNGQKISCEIQSEKVVEGFCFYLDESTVKDVFQTSLRSDEKMLDDPFELQENPKFYEDLFEAKGNTLGNFLAESAESIVQKKLEPDADFYFKLARELVESQYPYLREAHNLSAVKFSTKQELYRRLRIAREILAASDHGNISMAALAREAGLSQFHLFRTFKECFGYSPYQFLLQSKMERARGMLLKEQLNMSGIARKIGFTDLACFSKAFKKQYGLSPRNYLKQNSRK